MDDLIDEEMEPVFRGKCKLLGRWVYGDYSKKKRELEVGTARYNSKKYLIVIK